MLLYEILAFTTHEKKNQNKNNKFKIAAPT